MPIPGKIRVAASKKSQYEEISYRSCFPEQQEKCDEKDRSRRRTSWKNKPPTPCTSAAQSAVNDSFAGSHIFMGRASNNQSGSSFARPATKYTMKSCRRKMPIVQARHLCSLSSQPKSDVQRIVGISRYPY